MTDRNTFLSNHKNLKTFVKGLAAKLRILGFQVFEWPCDADTTIVKFALNSKEQSVIVYADDTNITSLLLHHYHNTPNLEDIFLTAMTRKSDHQQSKYYSIRGIINQLLKRGGKQRCPIYCLLMFSLVVIRLQPSINSGRLPFSKSSKTQNE